MMLNPARCLILACGNTLRGDDGVGPWLCAWAEERFASDPNVRTLSRQQWTPELAAEIAEVESVLFIDCSVESAAGIVRMTPVEPIAAGPGLATHHIGASELLTLGQELYNSLPRHALLLTVGADSTELSETFSEAVTAALPEACRVLESTILQFLTGPEAPAPDQRA
jgi:hydrogenase maturation protease